MKSKKEKVKNIFDTIAFRYDFLNHLLSGGLDFYWRRKALQLTGFNKDTILLDVACGTGDVAIEARKQGAVNIIGADFSYEMLSFFETKSSWIKNKCVQMTAEKIPFKENSFTNITVAFGVRNFYDIQKGFDSFYNVLKPNGKVTIIEFCLPPNKVLKALYKFYFKKILPVIGGIVSGNKEAYKYLPDSVEEFDEKVDIPMLLKKSGFQAINKTLMTFGVVQVVIGEKI